jgi:hypothetical protein
MSRKVSRDVTASLTKPGLPDLCYARKPGLSGEPGEVVLLRRGECGYYPLPAFYQSLGFDPVESNGLLGVSRAQAAAMLHGSLFGWDARGADPAAYDDDGRLRPKARRAA